MPSVDCPYYYTDYLRGRETETCRLLEASPEANGSWRRALCRTCPVPDTLRHTECDHLALEATIRRQWLSSRVQITFALCSQAVEELSNPLRCPACTAARDGMLDEQAG